MITDQPSLPKDSRLVTVECAELDVWSAAVGWETDYRQVGKGRFDAWFDISLCHDLRVVDQYCSRQMFGTGIPPANHVALLIPLNRGDRGIFQGKPLRENEVAVMGPGSEGSYRTPDHLRMLGLHVPISRLRKAFGATCDQELDPLVCQTRIIKLSQQQVDRFIWIAHQVIKAAPGANDGPSPPLWRRELEASFVANLVLGLTDGEEREPGLLARRNRVRYVTAARDYINAHLSDSLNLETLTGAIGVSERTLEYAFRDVCDSTPLQYIKACRLQAVRRQLLDADAAAVAVSSVALDHGLSHFSYFARDYHTLFGEYPSETLAAKKA